MSQRIRFAVASLLSIFILAGASVPLAVSAASSSRHNDEGTLKVYVEVEDRDNYERLDPRDFTVFVDARSPSKNHFSGSDNGTSVYFEGSYRVYVYGHTGYEASYSSGCSGRLDEDKTRTCRVTMEGSRYPYYPQQPYCNNTCAQPVTYVQSYVPGFPNTGFAPVDAAAMALAAVMLIGAGVYVLPYARKTITTIIG